MGDTDILTILMHYLKLDLKATVTSHIIRKVKGNNILIYCF